MSENDVRVRIAPSPTGYLHVGTARTAIFNYLFARRHGGKFLVRIEDTDAARSQDELIEPILSAFQWLGIKWDEEILYQSQRSDAYRKWAQQLLEAGHAYRCFCTPEQLKKDRESAMKQKAPLRYNRRCLNLEASEVGKRVDQGDKFAVRILIPEGETSFDDMVSGRVTRQNAEIEDFIIARSDGSATYNLAVVVDDHEMEITHVIRGNDHVTNTFKQLQIYRALGWNVPRFGHVPLILRPDRKKVSKRLGDKDVAEYRREGILPGPMLNYLCLLGWSPKTDREIYSPEELVEIFDADNFNVSNAIFDEDKLVAFNREHIQLMSDHALATMVAPLLVEAGTTTKYWLETRWEYLRGVVHLLKSRVKRLSDFVSQGAYFFDFDYKYDEKAAAKYFSRESVALLSELADRFESAKEFAAEDIDRMLTLLAEEKELKKAALIHPTRLSVSGRPDGPGLYDLVATIGQAEVVKRMRRATEFIEKQG